MILAAVGREPSGERVRDDGKLHAGRALPAPKCLGAIMGPQQIARPRAARRAARAAPLPFVADSAINQQALKSFRGENLKSLDGFRYGLNPNS